MKLDAVRGRMRARALVLVALLTPLAGCFHSSSPSFEGQDGLQVGESGDATTIGLGDSILLAPENGTAGLRIPPGGNRSAEHLLWSDALAGFDVSSGLVADGPLLARLHVGTAQAVRVAAVNRTFVTAATEGNEVTVFLRGSGRMTNSTAVILFPAEFRLLIGEGPLTVQLTLTAAGSGAYVAEKSPDGFRARTTDPQAHNATFDYFVQATRAGAGGFLSVR